MRKIPCPLGGWIGLPDEWLGQHLQRRDQAIEKAASYESKGLSRFAGALALIEDWGEVPGLDGNPDKREFGLLSLTLINWITLTVEADFLSAWRFPGISFEPSTDGSSPEKTESVQAGASVSSPPA